LMLKLTRLRGPHLTSRGERDPPFRLGRDALQLATASYVAC